MKTSCKKGCIGIPRDISEGGARGSKGISKFFRGVSGGFQELLREYWDDFRSNSLRFQKDSKSHLQGFYGFYGVLWGY